MFPFGFGRGGLFLAARVVLLVAFLAAVFIFHAHGSTLRILQVVRLVLLVGLLGSWIGRRRRI